MTNIKAQLLELLDRAEAEGSKVVAIEALRRLLDRTPTSQPSELEYSCDHN